ncbi:hypothetical protein O3G_MSEX012653 [Manduca sexta]|uniref:DUF4455 domain-containing protein n=1 Tax=Manduca sexta TaxID=7130 RepID=A0A921ZP28_MANSE|nr:hypothetical protein O3G_MSEX012653 [Manduca sexta]
MFSKKSSKQSLGGGKCKCETGYENVNLVAQPGCAEDDAAVAALPDTWEPKHSGPILKKYLQEREQKHEQLLKNMKEAAAEVNGKIDVMTRNLAEDLLAHIQQNQRNMDNIVDECSEICIPISKEIRTKGLNDIYQCFNHRIDDIVRFKLEALALERERADGLRIILRDHFQKLIDVGHLTPKDLLYDFDQRIYDINQQLLSNCRAYTELEARLRVHADESLVRMRSALNQLSLGVAMINRGRSAQPWLREERLSSRRTTSAVDKNRQSFDPSIKKILGEVEEFEECVSCLVQAYRAAVMKVFTGFSGKLSVLQRDLGSHHAIHDINNSSCEMSDLQQLIERTLRRLSSSVHQKQTSSKDLLAITGADITSMQKSLWSLGECFRVTYTILHDAGHLWDSHMLRLALAQKLTIAAVEDMLTSNDTLELANEMSFNVALEQLRCSSDVDKLQQHFEVIMTMLERTSDLYMQHSQAEIGRLQEFMNLPPYMSRTLLAEFDCFLEKHRRPTLQSVASMTSQPYSGSPKLAQPTALRSPLPRAILQTELQEIALQNWRNGFLESFQSNMSFVPEELQHQAQMWVEERASALHVRYSLKLVSNSIRTERVKAARDARLAELRYHENRLESHLAAVYNLIDALPIEASEFLSLDSQYLYPLCKWISQIQVDMDAMIEPLDPEVRRLKMLSYGPRLAKHRSLFEESLDGAIEQYKRQMEHRIQEGRISNVRFISQIRLFNEGGRYAAPEASKTCAALVKSADALEICANRAMDALNHRRNQLLALADQQLLPLQRVIEDVYKVGGKSQDKKKPLPPKKK